MPCVLKDVSNRMLKKKPRKKMKRLDERFFSITIDRKSDEMEDKNFPPHCYAAAMQLFLMCGMSDQAQKCGEIVTTYLRTLECGPDGKTSHNIGRACICWNCGHVGLPSNRKKCSKEGGYKVKPKCSSCKEKEQTNWIRVTSKDGKFVPFMELKSVASKEALAAAAGAEKKVKRNDKCPCGSGKKYKKCCLTAKKSSAVLSEEGQNSTT